MLQATQDQVKALAIARTLGSNGEAVDNDAFLRATWRVLQAERQCDALLRDARRVILCALTTRRQQDDFRRNGPPGQSLLAVTPGETRSRPSTIAGGRQLPGWLKVTPQF